VTDQKRSPRIDWEDLRVLIELARTGSLSGAARSLGITHVTVSRRISNLEADLAQALFTRDTGRYVLTDAGHRILELAEPMATSAEAIVRAASGLQVELGGPVRVTATEAVGAYLVVPALARIHVRYPEMDLNLIITQENLNLARNATDLAVRLARPQSDSGIHAIKVADLSYRFYGATSYVKSVPRSDFEVIAYPSELAAWPEVRAVERDFATNRTALRVNHLGNRIQAARLGMGIALLPCIMAAAWPDLTPVDQEGPPAIVREIYVLVHEDLKDVPRLKASMNVLCETISTLFAPAEAGSGTATTAATDAEIASTAGKS